MTTAKNELTYEDFVGARKLFWMQEARNERSDVVLPKFEEVEPRDSSFILSSPGSNGILAVFEDDGETGWFYLYEARQKKILQATHIYNHSNVAVLADEVDIGWAANDSACGLAVFGQFRAFLAVSGNLALRKPVLSDDEDGIPEQEWPRGFEHYLEKRID